MDLLQEMFCQQLLPRLSLRALQSFSHTCRAARAAASSLPEAQLHRLAQARLQPAAWSAKLKLKLQRSSSLDALQVERLPSSHAAALRPQLDCMARQVAAVWRGRLADASTQVLWSESHDTVWELSPWGDALIGSSSQGALYQLPLGSGLHKLQVCGRLSSGNIHTRHKVLQAPNR